MNISSTHSAHDHTSVARVIGTRAPARASACSGEQYAVVIPPYPANRLTPGGATALSPAAARAFASPKSETFAIPSRVTITLAGLMS